jgi:hypothetical protein
MELYALLASCAAALQDQDRKLIPSLYSTCKPVRVVGVHYVTSRIARFRRPCPFLWIETRLATS